MSNQPYPKYRECPCRSGQKYKFCCLPKGREYVLDAKGETHTKAFANRHRDVTEALSKAAEALLKSARTNPVRELHVAAVLLIAADGTQRYLYHGVFYDLADKNGLSKVTDLVDQIHGAKLLQDGERLEVVVTTHPLDKFSWSAFDETSKKDLAGVSA